MVNYPVQGRETYEYNSDGKTEEKSKEEGDENNEQFSNTEIQTGVM
jgi:hypothetical protein